MIGWCCGGLTGCRWCKPVHEKLPKDGGDCFWGLCSSDVSRRNEPPSEWIGDSVAVDRNQSSTSCVCWSMDATAGLSLGESMESGWCWSASFWGFVDACIVAILISLTGNSLLLSEGRIPWVRLWSWTVNEHRDGFFFFKLFCNCRRQVTCENRCLQWVASTDRTTSSREVSQGLLRWRGTFVVRLVPPNRLVESACAMVYVLCKSCEWMKQARSEKGRESLPLLPYLSILFSILHSQHFPSSCQSA